MSTDKAQYLRALGRGLAKARVRAGVTQHKAADFIGVTRFAVSRWEVGSVELGAASLLKLCSFYGASADELLGVIAKQLGKQKRHKSKELSGQFRWRAEKVLAERLGRSAPAGADHEQHEQKADDHDLHPGG
jgi:transcriptional regulator with XRE-family HTH domain